MKVVASRSLVRAPYDLVRLESGELVVLCYGDGKTTCEAFDRDLSALFSTALDESALALISAKDGRLWLLDVAGALALSNTGARVARVEVQPPPGMRLSAFAEIEDGFVFACEHRLDAPVCAPVLQRVGYDGTLRWSTTLPLETLSHEGVVEMRAENGWKQNPMPPWQPQTWICTSTNLCTSGATLLACFSEMPRSGIGFGYAVSLSDGRLAFTTKTGPIAEVAPLGGGAFLVGYQGYGAFETLRYEPDGRVTASWASHGHYAIKDDDVRVVELENVLPSKMHLVRLLPGGSVQKGAWLDGYATSRPLVRADGTLVFFRNGSLYVARDLSIDASVVLRPPNETLHTLPVVGDRESAYVSYVRESDSHRSGLLERVVV